MMGKQVLVTGAAGFLGSHLCTKLLELGHSVVGLDNLSMGKRDNLKHLEEDGGFSFVEGDVVDEALMLSLCEQADAVFHMAAFKIPRYGKSIETLRINALGTFSVLNAIAQTGCHFILASTSDVYGKNAQLPYTEEHDSVLGSSNIPRWSYATSKRFDEHLTFSYREAHSFPFSIVRIFGSYGPRHHLTWWGGPQSVFITAALKGESVEIHGDGEQTRSFCYVSDTVDGFIRVFESGAADGEIFNIGNDREISILQLAELIFTLCEVQGAPPISFVPYETFGKYEDVRRRVPDLSKAKQMLGFEPRVSLEEGLLQTIAWQRTQL